MTQLKPRSLTAKIGRCILWFLFFPAASCTKKAAPPDGPPQVSAYEWEGTKDDFLTTFRFRSGRFYRQPGDTLLSGKLYVSRYREGPDAEIHLREGFPYRWMLAGQDKPIQRWYQKGLWVGTDEAWEEDFRDMFEEKGVIYRPTSVPFDGMVLSIDSKTGFLEAQYKYEDGIINGPEIHYDESQNEVGRFNWVKGKILVQPI
jgi:hypothetical protein